MMTKIIEKINNGKFTRKELFSIRENAIKKLNNGDKNMVEIIELIDKAIPEDKNIAFMGFCPSADIKNRLDKEWKSQGICTFDFKESKLQLERFNKICSGDIIVLKKREEFGKTMSLHGHGIVNEVKHDANGNRYLLVNWAKQDEVIIVPLMALNSTIESLSFEIIYSSMTKEQLELFKNWLNNSSFNEYD